MKKKKNVIKRISLVFLSLIIISSILSSNFSNFYKGDDENSQLTSEMDLLNQKIPSSSSQYIWKRTWDGNSIEYGKSIWKDGTYLYTTGYTRSFGNGDYDLLLIKWDTDGNQIWNKTWGGSESDTGESIWGDGTYLYTTGHTYSFSVGGSDLVLIKWDTNGNQIWNKTWGGSESDTGESIWGDGTYLYTAGYTSSFGNGEDDLLLIKWDTDGTQIWNKSWGGSYNERGHSIWGDGTYLYTAGYTSSFGNGEDDLLLIKWDTDGNQIWNKTWGGSGDDQGYSIWGDGTYLYTTGYTSSFGYYSTLIKWDTDGNQIWNHHFDYSRSYSVWGDGTYLYTTGFTSWSGPPDIGDDAVIVKWDTDGTQIWSKIYKTSNNEAGFSILVDDTYFYLVGTSIEFYEYEPNHFVTNYTLFLLKDYKRMVTKPMLYSIYKQPILSGNISLNWTYIADATSYNIYRESSTIHDTNGLTPIFESVSSSYTDIGLTNGLYFYAVVAINELGVSDMSNCISVRVELQESPKISSFPFEYIFSIWGICIVFLVLKKRK